MPETPLSTTTDSETSTFIVRFIYAVFHVKDLTMNRIGEDSFILISGSPQVGKRERISKVRSHITRRQFQRQNQKRTAVGGSDCAIVPAKRPSPAYETDKDLRRLERPVLPPELSYTMLSAEFQMLKPTLLVSETTRRMEKFLITHMRGYVNQHPFFRKMITWSITHPYFTSAKLLSASSWDDVQYSGKLSIWSQRQRFIAVKLLYDVLRNENKVHTDVTIAAIQSLLAFESDQILTGGGENYLQLRRFSKSIVEQGVHYDGDNREFLTRFFFFLDLTHRLCTTPDNPRDSLHIEYPFEVNFTSPLDMKLFTFGHTCSFDGNEVMYGLIGDLYNILSIANSSNEGRVCQSTYGFVELKWNHLRQKIKDDDTRDETAEGHMEPIIAEPMRLCIFLVVSYLVSDAANPKSELLCQLAAQIREILSTISISAENNKVRLPFPGALLWCHAIGVRFADAGDKTWFLLQFMKTTHSWLLETWEETSKNISLVSAALGNVQGLRVEDTQLP